MSDGRVLPFRPFDDFALIVVLFVLLIIVGCFCFLPVHRPFCS
ncbi:YjcZ family sporulation protein [Caldalkalibacillus uzonensis]|nr:YjcZ family sporulation protein [Caldalkalibacillus uzonensis]